MKLKAYDKKHNVMSDSFSLVNKSIIFHEGNSSYVLNASEVFELPSRFKLLRSTEGYDVEGTEIFEYDVMISEQGEEYAMVYSSTHGGFVGRQIQGWKECNFVFLAENSKVKGNVLQCGITVI